MIVALLHHGAQPLRSIALACEHAFVSYVELHAHSAFSFLDGASLPAEIAGAAAQLGYEAFAVTDHNGLYGSMEFAQAAQGVGVKAIHGAEVDVIEEPWTRPAHRSATADLRGDAEAPRARHVTLLVRDTQGWRNLCRLLTKAHAHTRTPAGGPIVDAPRVTLDDLAEHAEGLICLTGCAAHGVHDERTVRRLLHAFGRDGLRIELQRPYQRHDRALNRELAELAARLGVPCVATGDVHAHTRERARLQDAFVAIREHTTLDASEPLRRGNHAHVLTSPQAMAARFSDHPDAVAETLRIADMVTFDLTSDLGYRYPGAEDAGADRRLAETCHALFDHRYPASSRHRAEAVRRLETELKLIAGLNLSGFFNLHHELLELAREVAHEVRGASAARQVLPPGRGRGSSVSSIVCYLTGLSHVDPIENELLLGRFLNEEITSLPDIDLDFPRDVREVLLPRIHERYGRERSALVAAFPTFKARGAIRELGKALGLPPGEIERVARGSEAWSGEVAKDIDVALGRERREGGGRWAWLAELAAEAQGLPRHLSQHSGGMIVATQPLVECCPVVPAAMTGRQMVHWDKDSCGDAGFLKIDLLGLGMLSAVERCVDLIAARTGETIDLSRIPYDDAATFASIQEADTTGVFQIESRAQMASLRRTRPETLEEITIQVAIVRPGPIQGGAVNPYIARRQRLREDPSYRVPYEHPSLEPVLKETLGAIIFQDQVIEVAMAFAGFSPGQAEGLRRAMSRKRSQAALMEHHEAFVAGAQETHPDVSPELAQRVWDMIVGFSGFGFPKAHGAAFGLLAYQSAWLRVHKPLEFLCALLDEQPMGFYPSDALIHEAQRRGVEVRPPDIRFSAVGCTIEVGTPPDVRVVASGKDAARLVERGVEAAAVPAGAGEEAETLAVRVGLGYVLGVRRDEVEAIVRARAEGGAFRSLEDLASRAGNGRAALETLAWSGACDALAGDRRRALWSLGTAAPGRKTADGTVQLALPLELPAPPELRRLDRWDEMIADYATTGVSVHRHPMALLRPALGARGAVSSGDLTRLPHGKPIRIGGLIVARQRPGTAKGVVFLLLEDELGTVNLVVPPAVYERDRLAVRTEPLLLAEGKLERFASAGGAINVVVHKVEGLEAPGKLAAEVRELDLAIGEGEPQEELKVAAGGDFRAVAPPVLSFMQGRSR